MSFRVFYKLPREGFWQQNSIKVSLCLFFVPVLPAKAAAPTANPCAALPVQELPWELLKNWEIFIRAQQIQHCNVSIEYSGEKHILELLQVCFPEGWAGVAQPGEFWSLWICTAPLDWGLFWQPPGSLSCAIADARVPQDSPGLGAAPQGQGGRWAQLPSPAWPSKHSLPWPLRTHLLEKGGNSFLQMNFQEGRVTKVQNNYFSRVCVCARAKPSQHW